MQRKEVSCMSCAESSQNLQPFNMDTFGGPRNYQLLVLLAQRISSLVIYLINHVRQEHLPVQETFRQALLPMHRVLTEFLFPQAHTFEHSFQLRDPGQSFHTLPSMPNCHFHSPSHHLTTTNRFLPFGRNVTPPEDITPPHDTPPSSMLGFTSTPIRPPISRPRPEPFALINQLLTAMHTSDSCNLSSVTDQYGRDPVFRDRILKELDELRSLIMAQTESTNGAAGQALRALLDRVEQAETTLSLLIHNLERLQND
ncbi:uncharacterized protein LOC118514464 isoform X1 [Anopheles stephensi]|uniref:uncharacterized protein LOC118514464 isoform X1 n=2 Tax=Anopheles stephensi TaxID=30069 RepID=UPI001658B7F9|nr:uncharacterized protein LOC118514464 isoform X1 [Anopheles stephensi]XP_035917277.1 uncharacterized protein LOC118514464 isoform X1 [Anopheles stephensi]XP_035917278.1 uncharacterized protein LOC118514464 isoform X1 [Anopheles stephensi]